VLVAVWWLRSMVSNGDTMPSLILLVRGGRGRAGNASRPET